EPILLAAGEGMDVSGAVEITATGDGGATILGGVIGPEVDEFAPPATDATPVADLASVQLFAFVCPADFDGESFAEQCVEPVGDVEFQLVIPATEFGVSGQTDAEGA